MGRLNVYRHKFVCKCPENGAVIFYELEIRSLKMIFVEKIVIACEMWQEAFHEKLADNLFYQFGEVQILRAHHHGVDVITYRGSRIRQWLRQVFSS